jgi:hypothetical protein
VESPPIKEKIRPDPISTEIYLISFRITKITLICASFHISSFYRGTGKPDLFNSCKILKALSDLQLINGNYEKLVKK